MDTLKTAQMRNRVRTVIGRPASICCQCRAEKPKEIISSWLNPSLWRNFLTRWPSALKNFCSLSTPPFVRVHEQKYHEQISCVYI